MKVWIVIKDEGRPYEPYPRIKKVFAKERDADDWVFNNDMYNKCDVEEWEVE